MDELTIQLQDGKQAFRPGEQVRAEVSWRLVEPPEDFEARLFWYTEGKGDVDVEIAQTVELPVGEISGRETIEFETPRGPLSFSGQLVSLIWAIEMVALPSGATARQQIVLSHTGREMDIREDPPELPEG